MRMNIGAIIVEKRKEKKITQQELADFIGVSKASVSKWETNQTYPDITLLPLLAAYFDITIDSLMDYESQLSREEIQRIYQSLVKMVKKKPAEEILKRIRSLIRRYYSCYPFLLQMGLLILNHVDALGGDAGPVALEGLMKEAKALFIHVRENAKNPDLTSQAVKCEALICLSLQEPDEALALLGEQIPLQLPPESLIAAALQMKGEQEKAIETIQVSLYQYIAVMNSTFTNYLHLLFEQEEKFRQTADRALAFADIFDFRHLLPLNLINLLTSSAVGYAQIGDSDALLQILARLTDLLEETQFPAELHGDAYFDQLDSWFESLDAGNQLPRETTLVKRDVIAMIQQHPVFLPYQDNEAYQEMLARLEKMQQQEGDSSHG